LGRNPFVCDCKLKWLNDYLKTRPVERSGITCSMPKRLAKKSIGSLPNSRFRCHVMNASSLEENNCGTTNECPKECSCQGGIVDCRAQNLNEIPFNIPEYATQM
jgi:hypothetical protein